MSVFKCKMCGGTLEVDEHQTVGVCEYCGTKQTLPRLDDDRRVSLYDRASHFRRNNDFDKADEIYEQILNDDSTDAEAYWSLVLCQYGIEYVESPETHKRVPTVNRAQFTSIFDDDNYKSALRYAGSFQKSIYKEEAHAINEIQKNILAISQKEEPFDVFICYKEANENSRRTRDSVLANNLYYELTNEGFKVFYARITLEDKFDTAYEPYIFAALNSAKVMIVLGTKPEYFNDVWVKNEWSRYLALVKKSGGKKALIPAYRDMDPDDLPEEFSRLQAQDMSKLGFMQDLIRSIKKSLRFGDDVLKAELTEDLNHINTRNENAQLEEIYNDVKSKTQGATSQAEYLAVAEALDSMKDFKDVDAIAVECRGEVEAALKNSIYSSAVGSQAADTVAALEQAINAFSTIPDWKDAAARIGACKKRIDELNAEAKKLRIQAKKRKAAILLTIAIVIFVITIVAALKAFIIPHYNTVTTHKDAQTSLAS